MKRQITGGLKMIDRRIVKFFRRHHVLTIATSVENEPWCASCFYVYLEDKNSLIFTTDRETRHGKEFLKNPEVAGAISLETKIIGKIRGIQFRGIITEVSGDLEAKAKKVYLKRFPVAMLMETHFWMVRITYIKYTDNRLGFGRKLIWSCPPPPPA